MVNYIKVKAELTEYVKDDSINVPVSRKDLREKYFALPYILNRHLAFHGTLNVQRFISTGEVVADDLVNYIHEDTRGFGYDPISKNITSIIPVYINFEDDERLTEDYLTRPLDTFLYFKIESNKPISKEDKKNLFKYLSGQISDGWGECFEGIKIDYWNKKEYSFYIHLNYDPDTFVLTDKLYRCYIGG